MYVLMKGIFCTVVFQWWSLNVHWRKGLCYACPAWKWILEAYTFTKSISISINNHNNNKMNKLSFFKTSFDVLFTEDGICPDGLHPNGQCGNSQGAVWWGRLLQGQMAGTQTRQPQGPTGEIILLILKLSNWTAFLNRILFNCHLLTPLFIL